MCDWKKENIKYLLMVLYSSAVTFMVIYVLKNRTFENKKDIQSNIVQKLHR